MHEMYSIEFYCLSIVFRLVVEKADLKELEPKKFYISILTTGNAKAQSEIIFNFKLKKLCELSYY